MNRDGGRDGWLIVAAIMVAIGLWVLSMVFSINGFGIASDSENLFTRFAGFALASAVTLMQVIFNRVPKNPTMWLFGVMAYIYGLTTNAIGYLGIRAQPIPWETATESMEGFLMVAFNVFTTIMVVFFVEVAPEHLLFGALRPDGTGDFITSLFKGGDLFSGLGGNGNGNAKSGHSPSRSAANKRGREPRSQKRNSSRGQRQQNEHRAPNARPAEPTNMQGAPQRIPRTISASGADDYRGDHQTNRRSHGGQ